jgi:type IV pilus assembly protein PilA
MMKRGFTIVELLAVIIVLGIILVIALPKVIDSMDKAFDKSYEISIKNIEKAAELYVTENPFEFTNGDSFTIYLDDLCYYGNLDCPVYNPDTEEEIYGYVQVTRQLNGTFTYEFIEE